MENKIIALLFILFSLNVSAQDKTSFETDGLVKASLTIAPGWYYSESERAYFLHGTLEYFAQENVSLCGETFYYASAGFDAKSIFRFQHSIMAGAMYHFRFNRSDLSLAFQPGINITSFNKISLMDDGSASGYTPVQVSPLWSLGAGYTFHMNRYLYFYLYTRHTTGSVLPQDAYTVSLSSFRVSGGLGFSLPLKK